MGRISQRLFRSVVPALLLAGALAPAAPAQSSPGEGPGGPILVVADPGDPFGRYYAEILRAEGLNAFAVGDPGALTPAGLAPYQVVVLARTPVNDAQLGALGAWVNGGGDLIAMRPVGELAGLLGLGAYQGELSEGYVRAEGGAGITGETLQFHGTADRWALAGADAVASLYANAGTPAGQPAVTLRSVGGAGGQTAAFAYDLARSVVFTRQGNPAWINQKRDGTGGPHRSDDLFVPDAANSGWVNLDKVRIPQADEQQRLLANLITGMARDRMPLPRFWYLPRGARAAVVMTGDDHGSATGTPTHFNRFDELSFAGCSVVDWQCVRATSYVYPGAQVAGFKPYEDRGYEIALHLDTGCQNYSAATLAAFWASQRPAFLQSGLAAPRTNRTHCIAWGDWVTQPQVQRNYGIRLDTNYYYYPAPWVLDRPGMFTGSGFPMRFADVNGTIVDVYQAATQMTDESAISYGRHAQALIDGALGPEGFYGVFTANIHTDRSVAPAEEIIGVAQARNVPVISAAQLLDWTDGRDGSAFRDLRYSGGRLTFTLDRAAGARGLEAMLPAAGLTALTRDGAPVSPVARNVKGIDYGAFDAAPGAYAATYGTGASPVVAPPATRSRDRSKPRVRIRPRTVRVTRKGRIKLRVSCPRSERRCIVALRVRGTKRGKRFAVAGGKTARVTLRLPRKARRKLKRGQATRVLVLVRARDAAGNRTRGKVRIRVRPRRARG